MKRMLLVLILFISSTTVAWAEGVGRPGANDGPPLGISPVTIKLQSVLDANDAAVGRLVHRSITDVEVGTLSGYGLTGTYRDVYAGLHSGDDYFSTETLGPFTTRHGRYQNQRWRQNENGITNIMQDTVRADENDVRSFVD